MIDNKNDTALLIDAEKIYEDALTYLPFNETVYKNLLYIYKRLNRLAKLESLVKKATLLYPQNPNYTLELADFYMRVKTHKKAIPLYVNLLKTVQKPELYNNLGVALKEIGELQSALESYKKGLELSPQNVGLLSNMGIVYKNLGEFELSLQSLQKAKELNPKSPDIYANLGALYKTNRRYEEAKKEYYEAIKLNPAHINANYDLSLILLKEGSYKEGFARYEARLFMSELASKVMPHSQKPRWRGEDIGEKTLLIQTEQGFGDSLMFARYILLVQKSVKNIVVSARKELAPLFAHSFPNITVFEEGAKERPHYDLFCLIGSLPFIYKSDIDSIPSEFPYLSSANSPLEAMILDKNRKNIGIAYSSSPTNKDFKNKIFPPSLLSPLYEDSSCALYSLQFGDAKKKIEEQIKNGSIKDISPLIRDFNDTSTFIKKLDTIITCDTALAHLCGALGVNAYVLLPFDADWRWEGGKDMSQSPWYKTLRLFRQESIGRWEEPIERVIKEVRGE